LQRKGSYKQNQAEIEKREEIGGCLPQGQNAGPAEVKKTEMVLHGVN